MDFQNYLPHFVLPARVWGAFAFCKLDHSWQFCFPKINFSDYHVPFAVLGIVFQLPHPSSSELGVAGPEKQWIL